MPKKTDVPLSLFSGTNSELRPVDLPEGVSPDNQDVIFLPGSADSRNGTHRIYTDALPGSPTTVYNKTFVQGNGLPLTLSLDSNGVLYQEDVFGAPNVRTAISRVTPGARCKSVTADGAEYFTFHDGAHGIDVPRQLTAGFFDRISQDGPGGAPTAADYGATVNIANPNGIAAAFAPVNVQSANQTGTTVTMVTAAPHGMFPSEEVVVAGVGAGYDFTGSIIEVPDATSFTYPAPSPAGPLGAGGTVRPVTVKITTITPHQMIDGAQFKIAGNSYAPYNNDTIGAPPTWAVQTVIDATSFFAVLNDPTGGNGGTCSVGGQISVGVHEGCVSFLLRSGHITKPGPRFSWLSAGGKQVLLSGLPIGPANTVARIVEFTGSGGAFFFWIPAATTGAKATIIADNVSTTALLDFADTTLFNATGIDIPGNNLFALHTLAPCLGVFFYASRLWVWREFNTVDRYLNMGFEGGVSNATPTLPLGWTAGAGGALTAAVVDYGEGWLITGDGSGNPRGMLTQGAYQDEDNLPILASSTQYTFYCWAKSQLPAQVGDLVAELFSPSGGVLASATIPLASIPNANGKFVSADFNAMTPAVIPADTLLRVYGINLANGQIVVIDELMQVFTAKPYRDAEFRASYVNDFESFDGETGTVGSTEDPNPLMCAGSLRGTMYFQSTERLHQTRDNGLTEPADWSVDEVDKVGAMSVDSMSEVSEGEDWIFTASSGASGLGLYIFGGGTAVKISQEYQTFFDGMNQAAKNTTWVVNDSANRRVYTWIASGSAAFPNLGLVMDYRELNLEDNIANLGPIHISFSGKMIASDLVRKWTRWNLTANCGALLTRPGGTTQFVIGAGNGQALGAAPGFGNSYYFDPAKLTDDDYGQMHPYYVTYGFITPDQEQAYQMGSHRKSWSYLATRTTGVGNLLITPLMNELTNPLRTLRAERLASSLKRDIERILQFSGERCFFKLAVAPLAGQSDVQFSVQRLTITMKEDPYQPVGGPR